MKLAGLLAVALLALCVNVASANFISIDNFDGNLTGNEGDGADGFALASGSGTLGISSLDGGFGAGNQPFRAEVRWENINDVNFGLFTQLRLAGSGTAADLVSTVVTVTGGTPAGNETVQVDFDVADFGSDLNFAFGDSAAVLNVFSAVTDISFGFQSEQAFTFTATSLAAVPEPSTISLVGVACVGLFWRRRKTQS